MKLQHLYQLYLQSQKLLDAESQSPAQTGQNNSGSGPWGTTPPPPQAPIKPTRQPNETDEQWRKRFEEYQLKQKIWEGYQQLLKNLGCPNGNCNPPIEVFYWPNPPKEWQPGQQNPDRKVYYISPFGNSSPGSGGVRIIVWDPRLAPNGKPYGWRPHRPNPNVYQHPSIREREIYDQDIPLR